MNNNIFLKYKHFKKFHTKNPYWLKHSVEDFKLKYNTGEYFEETEENDVWFNLLNEFEELKENIDIDDENYLKSLNNVSGFKTFHRISIAQEKWIKQNYHVEEIFTVPLNKKSEEKFVLTQQAINDPKIRLVINPVFIAEYQTNKNTIKVLSAPSAYLKDKKTFVYKSASTNVKKIDSLRVFFDISIANKLDIEIEDYWFLLVDSHTYPECQTKIKKEQINLYKFDWFNTSKSPISETKNKTFVEVLKEKQMYFKDFIQLVKTYQPTQLYPWQDLTEDKLIYKSIEQLCEVYDSDYANNDEYNVLWEVFPNQFTSQDKDDKLVFNTLCKRFANINGIKLLNIKKQFYAGVHPNEIDYPKNIGYIVNKFNVFNNDWDINIYHFLNRILKDNAITVWFDYEGYSLPYPPIDNVKPYNQIVSQVSIVVTQTIQHSKDNFEFKILKDHTKDIVLDPLKISTEDFFEILSNIYLESADAYVVWNKGYESVRSNEMLKYMQKANMDKDKIDLATQMYNEIFKEKLIDIMIPFQNSTQKYFSLYELKGKFSIKLVEKIVSLNKKNINLDHYIKPYKTLEIKNGMMAMETTISRYCGTIGDKEWTIKEQLLKEYCHNDVIAMIMACEFLLLIVKEKKADFIDPNQTIW
ncbi:UU173 family protein [Mycoplasma phocoenae]|uniref:DUF2779 domain-containing protein n=1 Tax=Mycoplasma phocoenae TaxID=754517 RepID=A0A858U7N0_9MOLU|nr:DUF2779 domain-containing protein [Mycoplasma phocoenae]QJG67255.1 DUF2779 domain-containing protein [Mycoplasma phocoenae]